MTITPNAAIRPYAFVQPPTSYTAQEETKERVRIKQGMRPINVRTVSVDDMLTAADDTVLVDTTLGVVSVTLPRANGSRNLQIHILNIGSNTLTVVGTVNGVVNPTFAQFHGGTVICDGTAFFQVSSV